MNRGELAGRLTVLGLFIVVVAFVAWMKDSYLPSRSEQERAPSAVSSEPQHTPPPVSSPVFGEAEIQQRERDAELEMYLAIRQALDDLHEQGKVPEVRPGGIFVDRELGPMPEQDDAPMKRKLSELLGSNPDP